MAKTHPRETAGWRFVLAGGSPPENPYLEKIQDHLRRFPEAAVELRVNLPASDLKAVYGRAKIFWHSCGLGQTDPAKVEHFGMTAAEAMQNGCVPVVFRGGGLTETIEDGISGLLFSSEKELVTQTLGLMGNPARLEEMSGRAHQRGKAFRREIFADAVRDYFSGLLAARFLRADSG
jgi:glycosyltransferase involved in cell wall biosynthesis